MGHIIRRGLRRAQLLEPCPGDLDRLALVDVLQVLRVRHGRIARQQNHRNMGARGFGQGGDTIGQSRTVSDCRKADPAGHAPMSQRHQNSASLIGHGDETCPCVTHEMVDHKEIGVPHQPEHRVEAVIGKRLGDGLVNVHFSALRFLVNRSL